MSLFKSKRRKKETKFDISEEEKFWIEDNFKWLIQNLGYPKFCDKQILFNKDFFPSVFDDENINIDNFISDISKLLDLDTSIIKYEIRSQEEYYDCSSQIFIEEICDQGEDNNIYKLSIADRLTKERDTLLYNLVITLGEIKLLSLKLKYDNIDDTFEFLYINGIYMGFGIILTNITLDLKKKDDCFYENISQLSYETIAYSFAIYSKIIGKDNPEWKNNLPKIITSLFEDAIWYMKKNPSILLSTNEIKASLLFYESLYQSEEKSISTLKEILSITKDRDFLGIIYSDIGRLLINQGKFAESIEYLELSVEHDPNIGSAKDVLAYSYFRTGKIKEGRKYTELAFQTQNNHLGESFRNYALYYYETGEKDLALENFRLAFEHDDDYVYGLEYHYAKFLLDEGKTKEGFEYLKKSIDKENPDAIELMKKLNTETPET